MYIVYPRIRVSTNGVPLKMMADFPVYRYKATCNTGMPEKQPGKSVLYSYTVKPLGEDAKKNS